MDEKEVPSDAARPGADAALEHDDSTTRETEPPTFREKFLKAVFGVSYDVKHWAHLPPATPAQKMRYVLTRNDRSPYVLLWALFVVLIIVGVVLIALPKKREPPVWLPRRRF